MSRGLSAVALAAGLAAGTVSAQDTGNGATAATYALPEDRVTTWRPGVTYNGGIPPRPKLCATLAPSGGDDTAAIQSAVERCPAGQTVKLDRGTFKLRNPGVVMKSDVTLRGSGPDQTTLQQTGSEPCVRFGPGWWPDNPGKWGGTVDLAEDAVKGQRSVRLKSATSAGPGEIVHLDETYDPELTWFSPERQTADYLGWGEGRKGMPSDARPIGQAMEIASVKGTTVTFTTPFHQTYRVSHAAHLARPTSGSLPYPTTRAAGVEALKVTGASAGDGWGNIVFYVASGCWAKNIESASSDIAVIGSVRCEIRDSYLHTAGNPNPGGGGYGLVIDTYSADNLVENDIVWSFNKVMVMRSSGGGNVIGYNYMEDGYGQGYPTLAETGINASHMTTPHHELFEGNEAFNADSDSTWGNSIYITFFRNHLTGLRRNVQRPGGPVVPLSDGGNKRAAGLTIHHWWYSFVGNVLGYPTGYLQSPGIGFAYPNAMSPGPQGKAFHYEWVGGPHGGGANPSWTPMWQLGYDGARWVPSADAVAIARTLRDGNYDYFTKQQKWHGIGGVAGDPVSGAGATTPPAASALPDSLYAPTKPAFFGSNPWPWVNPGTGALAVLPARRRFDAGTPNDVTP